MLRKDSTDKLKRRTDWNSTARSKGGFTMGGDQRNGKRKDTMEHL